MVTAKRLVNEDQRDIETQTEKFNLSERKEYLEISKQREIIQTKFQKMEQARKNLEIILLMHDKGIDPSKDSKMGQLIEDIYYGSLNALKEIENIGSDEYSGVKEPEITLDDFRLSGDGLRKSLEKTNVLDVIRNAKRNGWEVIINDQVIELYKDGKRIIPQSQEELEKKTQEKGWKEVIKEKKCKANKTNKTNKQK